jgi:hypothetical protein
MARNVGIQHLRGLKANIPALLLGEAYFCTDTHEVFIGGSGGNVKVNVPVYTPAGNLFLDSVHIVAGRVTLSSGSATVTLTGAAAFTSATSYFTVISTNTSKRSPYVVQNSGSSFTVNDVSGDVVNFVCIGT